MTATTLCSHSSGKDESDDDTSTVSEDLCGIPDSTAEHNVIIQNTK